jgi:hypothetical protein
MLFYTFAVIYPGNDEEIIGFAGIPALGFE